MADIYGQINSQEPMTAGFSYEHMLKDTSLDSKRSHAPWLFDDNKTTLLYAFIHRTAALHPRSNIVVDFFDDTCSILKSIHEFFSKNPLLLPSNVILKLHEYAGADVIDRPPLQGKGDIDYDYPWTVRYMALTNLKFTIFLKQSKFEYPWQHSLYKAKIAPDLEKNPLETVFKCHSEGVLEYFANASLQIEVKPEQGSKIIEFVKLVREHRSRQAAVDHPSVESIILPLERPIVATANYTTAKELHEHGLSPISFR
jgi:hypothetical protein